MLWKNASLITSHNSAYALEEHGGKVKIDGRAITNLRFADDIDALAEKEQEMEA